MVLHGPPGGGKTALALSWASDHRDEFGDGVVYLDLHDVPSRHQGDRALSSLGLTDGPLHPGAATWLSVYRSALAGAHVLLVLDGVVSSEQARMFLPPSDRAMVMVLSGEHLDGLLVREAAHPVEVGALEPADARDLVRHTVVRGPQLEDGTDLTRLVAWCGHWPLALRGIAARLSADPHLTAGALLQELAGPSDVVRLADGTGV